MSKFASALVWLVVCGSATCSLSGCADEGGERDSTIVATTTGTPGGMGSDSTHMYWAYGGVLERRDLQGQNATKLAEGPEHIGGVLVDSQAVYYVKGFYDWSLPVELAEAGSSVVRYDKATGATKVLASVSPAISFVALRDGFVYFAPDTSVTSKLTNSDGAVYRVDAEGKAPATLWKDLGWTVSCRGLVATEDALWVLSKKFAEDYVLTKTSSNGDAVDMSPAFPQECLEKSALAASPEGAAAVTGSPRYCVLTEPHMLWGIDAASGNSDDDRCDGGALWLLDRATGQSRQVSGDGCSPRYGIVTSDAVWWVDVRMFDSREVQLRKSARP